MLTPAEYDILLGKFVVLGKALEVIQASVEDGLRTLATLRPDGIRRAVPPGTPPPSAPTKVRVTRTLGGGRREKVLDPDEVANQATAPARDYISTEDSGQGATVSQPSAKGAGKQRK